MVEKAKVSSNKVLPGKKAASKSTKAPSTDADFKLEPILSWEAPASIHYEKSRLWYIIAGTIVIIMIVYLF